MFLFFVFYLSIIYLATEGVLFVCLFFKSFRIRSTAYLLKACTVNHISILFEGQCRRYLDTFNNHYDQQKGFLGDLKKVFFNRPLASSVGVKDGTLVSDSLEPKPVYLK